MRAWRPSWMVASPRDWLNEPFRRQKAIWQNGVVVWAALVQANKLLFQHSGPDCPASILISPHPFFEENLEPLMMLASQLYDLKGEDVDDPELAEFSRVLEDELDRAPGLQVPTRFTGGRPVFHTAIQIVRKHLPQRHLKNGYFPVVVDPTDFKSCFVLPAKYWSPAALADWE